MKPFSAQYAWQLFGDNRHHKGRVFLPESALQASGFHEEDGTGATGPFTVMIQYGSTIAYAGVEEFSADPDVIVISNDLAESLGLPESSQLSSETLLSVRRVQVAKATSLTLQPLSADFRRDILDPVPMLTAQLSQHYTVIYPSQLLRVDRKGRDYRLLVAEVTPPGAKAVDIINTNCNLTILPALDHEGPSDTHDAAMGMDDRSGRGNGVGSAASLKYGEINPLRFGEIISDASTVPDPAHSSARVDALIPAGDALGAAATASDGRVPASADAFFVLEVPPAIDTATHDILVEVTPRAPHSSGSGSGGGHPFVLLGCPREVSPQPCLALHCWAAFARTAAAASPLALRVSADALSPFSPYARRQLAETSRINRESSHALVPALMTQLGPSRQLALRVQAVQGAGSPPVVFSIAARAVPRSSAPADQAQPPFGTPLQPSSGATDSADAAPEPGKKLCPSCRAQVPEAAFLTHSAMCARNNVRCSHAGCGAILRRGPEAAKQHSHCRHCSNVLPEADIPLHTVLMHDEHPCGHGCVFQGTLAEVVDHMTDSCTLRQVVCRFCGDSVVAGPPPADFADRMDNLCTHESICGSRTGMCGTCGAKVIFKKMKAHYAVLHPGMEPVAQLPSVHTEQRTAAPSSARGAGGERVQDALGLGFGFDISASLGGSTLDGASPMDIDALATRGPSRASGRTQSVESEHGSHVEGWACSACTFHNSEFMDKCEMCAAGRPKMPVSGSRSGSFDVGDSSVSGTIAVKRSSLCANQTCTHFAASNGVAAPFGLCFRCYQLFAFESNNPHELADSRTISERYSHQLELGCGRTTCRNRYCVTGKRRMIETGSFVDGLATSSSSNELAFLLVEAANDDGAGRYYVCVDHDQKIPPSSQSSTTPRIGSGLPTVPSPFAGSIRSVVPRGGKKPSDSRSRVAGAFF
jgi:hypothetical protein